MTRRRLVAYCVLAGIVLAAAGSIPLVLIDGRVDTNTTKVQRKADSDRVRTVEGKATDADDRARTAAGRARVARRDATRTRRSLRRVVRVLERTRVIVRTPDGRLRPGPVGPAGPAGPSVTTEQLVDALEIICGETRCRGADAPAVTAAQLIDAIEQVCARRDCRGPTGDTGPPGPAGPPGPVVPCAQLDPSLGYACQPPPDAVPLRAPTTVSSRAAARSSRDTSFIAISESIADRVWGTQSCGGNVTVTRGPLPGGIVARAWHGPFPPGDPRCAWIVAEGLRFGDGAWCTVELHERGHTAGALYPDNTADPVHSLNPRKVMFASFIEVDERCERAGLTSGTIRDVDEPALGFPIRWRYDHGSPMGLDAAP